ncbi:transcriptional regulator, TetR family [Desulforamulus reducens MI-1]|uniref:Transcriptional regulator, TetR family n=1 Tax=Desulforamulus reducens (strain ATCC BAA-1160 / DSM 100696 / MI-1) TaxID=349161 RepID=A4J4W5_DESRM|nr:TetR/AcrR family transcriptional regulator [Desulforamulus reducens]ABO50118.1 transcriptional regulator, TetR family [Desulforamulus reducens MI-1]
MEPREKIIVLFRELAEERGFYGVTVDELAARNNMSKRTIYRYFKSKEEIVEGVMRQFMLETEKEVFQVLQNHGTPIERITNFVKLISERLRILSPRVLSELQRHYPDIWEQVEQFRAEKIKYLIEMIVEGSKEGYFKEINPTIVTASLLSTVRSVVNPTFVVENNLTIEEAFKTVMHTFLYGIVADQKLPAI